MNFFTAIDWSLLREQKQILMEVIEEKSTFYTPKENRMRGGLEGILGLLDSLQDFAVDHKGIPEEEVFNHQND